MFENIDIDLLRKYDEPGPRYTSYPTAPLFDTSFGPGEFGEEIVATNAPGVSRPLSLYFHLPFCDELCYFCGCTMLVTKKADKKERYLDALDVEIERVAAMIDPGREVVQLHWGGGTPTTLSPDQLRRLAGHIRKAFRFAEDAEVSSEIDPRGLSREHLEALRASGFNRISMGVQDFNNDVQVAVNRIQPEALTRKVVNWCRELGFDSINLDFIYGLPHQTVAGFEDTLDRIISIAPDRLAMFSFAYVPWLKKHHEQLINDKDLPSVDVKLRILKSTIERLCAAGYTYIGMDHFARDKDELTIAQREGTLYRNFQGYSTKSGSDLYAFGMSGISNLENVYAQNHKTLPEYYDAVDNGVLATRCGYRLNHDDRIRREVITRLMCDFELNKSHIAECFDVDFDDYFAESTVKLGRFVDDGLVEPTEAGYRVTPTGRLVIRNIAMCFDRYIDGMRKSRPIFSRTV